MPIDPLGIEKSSGVDPLGIEGPIQKMKPTFHDYWGDIGAAIEPLTPHGLLSQPTRLMNVARQAFGAQPYADPNTGAWLPNIFNNRSVPDAFNSMQPSPGGPEMQFISPLVALAMKSDAFRNSSIGQLLQADPSYVRMTKDYSKEPQTSVSQFVQGVGQPVNELLSQSLTSEGLAMLPAFTAGPLATTARALLAGDVASHVPELVAQRAQQAGADPSIANVTRMVAGSALDAAVPYGIARFSEPSAPRQNVFPAEIRQGSPEMPFLMKNRPGIPMEDKPQFYETPPLIGERPLTIEQPIIRLGEINPQDPLQIEKGIGFSGEPKQGGQISFQGQGIPSAMQSRVIPKGGQSEQAALMQGGFVSRVEKTKLQSGINPDDLLPAINFAGKLLIGRQGDTHADILERNGIDPRAVAHPDPARGFVNSKTGEFLSRLEAQKQSGIVGTAKAGGLDSMDLPGAAKTKVMRDSGFSDSEIKENLKLQSGLNYDKILPGGKDDPMFPILTRIQDAGYETLYSEHGMGEGDSTPYVVFKRTTDEKDARIKEAAKVVGAEVEERPKRIGVYLKESDKVEDIKKDWESFTKYLSGGTKLHSGLEPIEDVFTPTARLLLRDPKRLRYEPSKTGEFDGGQLVNRLMNQVPPIEKDLLEKAGIKEKFKAGSKVKAEEVDQWVKENSPKTEVKEYGMEGKVSEAREKYDKMTHEWYENLRPNEREAVRGYLNGSVTKSYFKSYFQKELFDKAIEYENLLKKANEEIDAYSGPRATTAYKSVSPFDTTKYPVKRVDVVLPTKTFKDLPRDAQERLLEQEKRQGFKNDPNYPFDVKWEADGTHEQLPNTLGWAMMQYKDGVAFIGEVQSRWGQEKRELTKAGGSRDQTGVPDHLLLRDYNRLILKAAIDQARKDGAKRIVLSDAETAMMTEGHDLVHAQRPVDVETFDHEDEAQARVEELNKEGYLAEYEEIDGNQFNVHYSEPDISQEKGMRFNYDTAMPQIMEELTGKKGEKVEMGEHKNIRNRPDGYDVMQGNHVVARIPITLETPNAMAKAEANKLAGEYNGSVRFSPGVRENLIFRNADSTPKTSVTGLSYDISEVGQPPYSMFGKKLYSGLPIFDESLWGSKEEAERMKGLFEKRQGKQEQGESVPPTITSMPPVKDLDKAQSIASKIGNTIVAKLSGFGVDRPMNEAIEAFTAKQAGWSAPRHVAANEELGNKLIRVAAADIASATEAKASSPENAAKIKAEAYKSLYKAYIDIGLGKEVTKGEQTPTIGGQPMEKVFINKKPLWIRKDLAPEFNQALQSDSKVMKAGASLLMDLATEAQIIGPTDFVFHMANMYASIAYDLGAKTTEGDLVRGTVPGARHVDAFTRIGYNVYRALVDSPEVQRELADIAKIGALRETRTGESLISRIPKVGKYIDTGEWIKVFDKAGRLARNKMFDNMVERKLLKDTELDRREFINKMGQYNSRLMSKFQDFQRQYFSQFVVAGRTFNRNAFQRVFMMNQARALNPSAYWKMKALNAASLYSALLVTPVVINSLITGKPFGRLGTDIGAIDTGKNDKDGRPIQIDLLQTTLLRRGLRITGLQALQRDVRAEKDMPTTAVDMAKDVANGLIQPWSGPPVRVGYTMMTGKGVGFGGFKYSKDTDSVADNFMAGLAQVNPMIASSVEAKRKGTSKTGEFVERTASAVGYKKGPFPTHEQDLEQETGKKVSEMPLSERVQAEKSHKEKAEKLSPETKAKAAEKSIENITKRGEELSKQMTKADRQWMESRGLYLPGFDNKIHAGKTLVYLTKDEMERLSKYTLESYNEAMTEVRQKYPQLGDNSKDLYFNARMSAARGKARTRIIQELNSLNESNQKTKKRFTVFDNE